MVTPKRQRFKPKREERREKNMMSSLEIKKTDVYLSPISKKGATERRGDRIPR
jgi:hypothetical protein